MSITIDNDLRRLANTLKGLPNEQDREPPPGLNLPGHTFQQKLLSPETVEAHLSIAYHDHLKGQVVVDFFAHVLAGEFKVLDNLRFIVEEARKENPKPMLSLPLILVECGLRLNELPRNHLRDPDVRRRFDARNAVAGTGRAADPYYLAIAALVLEQVAVPRRSRLAGLSSRQEIKAILFADAVLGLQSLPAVEQALTAGDPFRAGIEAGEALQTLSTPELLQQQLTVLLSGGK